MLQIVTQIIKWVSPPALLVASICSRYAASYELLADVAICLGAVILLQRAVRSEEYFRAAGLVAVAIVVSPLMLVVKILLLMGFTYIATFVTLLAAFRTQSVPAGHR